MRFKRLFNIYIYIYMLSYNTKYGVITLLENELYIGNDFKRGRYWDEDTLLKLKKYIDSTQNILEIGGHCGTSSIVYASFLDDNSKLFVYEPQEKMYKLLLKNIYQNGLETKIIANNSGIFCYEGIGTMNNIDLDGGGGNVKKRYTEETNLMCNFGGIGLGFEGETIKLTTIDNLNLSNLGFIHCDAQGAENFIFSNSLVTVTNNKPFILYEDNQLQAKYLYENVCKAYPQYKNESEFNIKKYCVENLNYSFIDNFNGSIDTLLIPPQNNFVKIIHITHKIINDKLLNVKKQWEDLNPEYKVELYDDERCIEVLHNYYGEKFTKIFNFIKDGPIKSDFFRVCILYIYGGIYVDADIKPIMSLKDYVDDDVDLMTCISYNYKGYIETYNYNPQFIVSKRYSSDLLGIINLYEKKYDNTDAYSYWSWSICSLFKTISNFEIIDDDNTFIFNGKKYKFLIEEIKDCTNNLIYNYKSENLHRDLPKNCPKKVYCRYKNLITFDNFANK